ncbi:MAG: Eco29kI family restriction endonuclease [Magnetococcus sp. WYHC-3]
MISGAFDRAKHVYRSDAFAELVKDAVRFFNGTPVHILPPPQRFAGTGVYALYFTGRSGIYAKYGELNRLSYGHPVYVGKAVPKGWRQARVSETDCDRSTELYSRLRQHSNSIKTVGMPLSEFTCRFIIFQDAGSDMIGTIESALIKLHKPLWNVSLDGFGNHDPGKGRYEQARSDWDVIHPGRPWAAKCQGQPNELSAIKKQIESHLNNLQ